MIVKLVRSADSLNSLIPKTPNNKINSDPQTKKYQPKPLVSHSFYAVLLASIEYVAND